MRSHTKLVPTSSSSSKNHTKQDQPHLSGAYIRNLVKQLSSSSTARSKDHNTMSTSHDNHQQPSQQEEQHQKQAQTPSPPPPLPHKKQVRRRLHTSRPYQERLLNMAEARREIVTALKIHRATMRQAKEQQEQQQQAQQQQQLLQLQQQQELQVVQEQSQAIRVTTTPMGYASFSDYLYNSSLAHTTCTSNSYPSDLAYHIPTTPMVGFDHGLDHLVTLPTQPLGLNLSFQGFNGVADDAKESNNCSYDQPLIQPSPTSSYSAYSSPSAATMASHDTSAVTAENAPAAAVDASLHRVLDDEEMAVIYSIGERHDIEWSDTVNLVTSAWWSKLLDSVEVGGGGKAAAEETQGGGTGKVMGIPEWLCDGVGHDQGVKERNCGFLEMQLTDYYHHGDELIALPSMDIGEIEGWDTEWFT